VILEGEAEGERPFSAETASVAAAALAAGSREHVHRMVVPTRLWEDVVWPVRCLIIFSSNALRGANR
jgi:hypothetical protein